MDIVDSATRSRMMSGIRGRDTKPEMTVRKFLHARGYRFRLHRKDLPGRPDLVLPRFKTCIFIHGCFWHHHEGCRFATLPKTRADFWAQKLRDNVERDRRVQEELVRKGWRVLTIWECELKSPEAAFTALLEQLEALG
ncbi:very short patch repair endonuclease [Pseudomonas aeruginosa]|uniref:very short patch repair endonuclease n=1 Tax=Pseudomonas aeruginosa TaxID=287 RepID=UPI001A285217|nr:very short patch repair endonuclease [Pseudomonas aeruginosa]MBG7441577.1 DNA mismatch endonuclease Vsr [Pseudomonas aeruginosa]MDU0512589.1 very short patch repair endonuclease [Pseudomonas aeruginosa]HED8873731.1 DNA mismatch endonuclease Vsr [Pseudomonas aeruginosa]